VPPVALKRKVRTLKNDLVLGAWWWWGPKKGPNPENEPLLLVFGVEGWEGWPEKGPNP